MQEQDNEKEVIEKPKEITSSDFADVKGFNYHCRFVITKMFPTGTKNISDWETIAKEKKLL